jgi:hypothetical protein
VSKPYTPLQAKLAVQRATGYTAPAAPAPLPQVNEFLHLKSITSPNKVQEPSDLHEHAGAKPHNRSVIGEADAKTSKYEIETGIGRDGKIWSPLEPWTCPVNGGTRLYREIMFAAAPPLIDGFTGEKLTAVRWMHDVQLVTIAEDGQVLPLSDERGKKTRSYPGAPVTDKRAGIGRYLKGHGRNLVLAALCNLAAGKQVRRGRGRATAVERGDGIEITAERVCKEANAIKAKRGDLGEHRFLSLSACRQLIRDLLTDAVIEELRSPKPVRQNRSWRTLPRIISKTVNASLDRLARPISPPTEVAAA